MTFSNISFQSNNHILYLEHFSSPLSEHQIFNWTYSSRWTCFFRWTITTVISLFRSTFTIEWTRHIMTIVTLSHMNRFDVRMMCTSIVFQMTFRTKWNFRNKHEHQRFPITYEYVMPLFPQILSWSEYGPEHCVHSHFTWPLSFFRHCPYGQWMVSHVDIPKNISRDLIVCACLSHFINFCSFSDFVL